MAGMSDRGVAKADHVPSPTVQGRMRRLWGEVDGEAQSGVEFFGGDSRPPAHQL